jgi:hypothetical protein
VLPVDAPHDGPKYSAERGRKHRAVLKHLAAEDVSRWKDRVDRIGGTQLAPVVNIVLLDG